jgi:arylsulfatase
MAVPLGAAAGDYMKVLFEYPPQFKVGFLSNNPSLYDVIPEGEMAIKAWLKKHGFGRFQP